MGKCLSIPIITLSIYNINLMNGYSPSPLQEQEEIKAMLPDYLKHLSGYLKKRTEPLRSPTEIDEINQAIFSRHLLMQTSSDQSPGNTDSDSSDGNGNWLQSQMFLPRIDLRRVGFDGEQTLDPHDPNTELIILFDKKWRKEFKNYGGEVHESDITKFKTFYELFQQCLISNDVPESVRKDYITLHIQFNPLMTKLVQNILTFLDEQNGSETVRPILTMILQGICFDGEKLLKIQETSDKTEVFKDDTAKLMYSLAIASTKILLYPSYNAQYYVYCYIYQELYKTASAVGVDLVPTKERMMSIDSGFEDLVTRIFNRYKGKLKEEYDFGWIYFENILNFDITLNSNQFQHFGSFIDVLVNIEDIPYLNTDLWKLKYLTKVLSDGTYDLSNYAKPTDTMQVMTARYVQELLIHFHKNKDQFDQADVDKLKKALSDRKATKRLLTIDYGRKKEMDEASLSAFQTARKSAFTWWKK